MNAMTMKKILANKNGLSLSLCRLVEVCFTK